MEQTISQVSTGLFYIDFKHIVKWIVNHQDMLLQGELEPKRHAKFV